MTCPGHGTGQGSQGSMVYWAGYLFPTRPGLWFPLRWMECPIALDPEPSSSGAGHRAGCAGMGTALVSLPGSTSQWQGAQDEHPAANPGLGKWAPSPGPTQQWAVLLGRQVVSRQQMQPGCQWHGGGLLPMGWVPRGTAEAAETPAPAQTRQPRFLARLLPTSCRQILEAHSKVQLRRPPGRLWQAQGSVS